MDVRAWFPKIPMIALALLLVSGCSGTKVTAKASSQLNKYQVHTIALIPFETMATPQAGEAAGPSFAVPSGVLRSDMVVGVPPTTDHYASQTHLVPAFAGEKITDLMWVNLRARSGLQLISPRQSARVAREISGGSAVEMVSTHKIAQRLRADAALSGKVLVYQERVGGRLGADPPAAVGFEVKLVASDGMVLWEGNYYERQRPMTEDLWGFIQRYGMFVTAEELAAYGAAELADAFPFGGAAGGAK